MRLVLVVLSLAGCASSPAWVKPGAPLTKLPPGLSWCGTGPEQVPVSSSDEESPIVEKIPGELLQSCTLMLRNACIGNGRWRGSLRFWLSSDVRGHLTDVCVVGGNFGEATDYVACLVAEIKRSAVIDPEMKRGVWTMIYVCD